MFLEHYYAWSYKNLIRRKKRIVFAPFSEGDPKAIAHSYSLTSYLIMTQDAVRMAAYERAIRDTVKNKVVVEIGTGALAPLAQMCVKSGAKKIYAIEANQRAYRFAKKLIKRRGLIEKITLIPGFAEAVSLPEKADVLVHELIGSMGSNEGMVGAVQLAKDRFLKEDAAFIPAACSVSIVPVKKPPDHSPWLYRLNNFLYWRRQPPKKMGIYNFPVDHFLSEPLCYERKDFYQPLIFEEQKKLRFQVTSASQAPLFNGLLLWVHVTLTDNNEIDCLHNTCWSAIYVPICQEGFPLRPNDIIQVETTQNLREAPYYHFHVIIERGGKSIPFKPVSFH